MISNVVEVLSFSKLKVIFIVLKHHTSVIFSELNLKGCVRCEQVLLKFDSIIKINLDLLTNNISVFPL